MKSIGGSSYQTLTEWPRWPQSLKKGKEGCLDMADPVHGEVGFTRGPVAHEARTSTRYGTFSILLFGVLKCE